MVRLRGRACASAAALLLLACGAGRTEVVRSTSVLVQIPRLAQLVITGDVSGLLILSAGATGETAYDAGAVESAADAVNLTLNTNDQWDLSARLAGSWNCPGTYDKAENDLFIRISNTPTGTIRNGASSYINLAGTDTQILSHDSAVTDDEVDIQAKVLLDWTKDIPGSYDITVIYTLVTHLP